MLQAIKPDDKVRRVEFAVNMLQRLDDEPEFLDNVLVSVEATFHISGCVNRHGCQIWGSENPYVTHEHIRDSPNISLMRNIVFSFC